MKYPALDVSGVDDELLIALVDDFSPTAVDQHDNIVTLFFSDATDRDRAWRELVRVRPDANVRARDVDDEDWARRSQENLTPISVGRITVTPPWLTSTLHPPTSNLPPSLAHVSGELRRGRPLVIVIAPSMGFGTGHHATTRLCLAALQTLNLAGGLALDVGTGSGVLAIAARLLGAREAMGIDYDPDAIQSARENLTRNPFVDRVRFEIADLRSALLLPANVVTANLTGALLMRSAPILLGALEPAGTLVVSGLQASERHELVKAFAPARVLWEAEEDGWVGLGFGL